MTDDAERIRQLRARMDDLRQETAAEPEPSREAPPRRFTTVQSYLIVTGFLMALIVAMQSAFTLMSHSGNDFADARQHGQATVEQCRQRGPVGMIYSYWDECLVSIKWDSGVTDHRWFDKPHLFHADEVGTTVVIGDNGYYRNGPTYSRPTLPPRPLLLVPAIVIFVIAAIPTILLILGVYSALRDGLRNLIKRKD